jgi:sulfatase modifying factor 1
MHALSSCEAAKPPEGAERPVPSAVAPDRAVDPRDVPGTTSAAPPASAPSGPCPEDMVLVDTDVCPQVQRTCLKDEYSKANKITICHRFAEAPPKCTSKERRQRFCIDRYEAPNREGARAPVMVDFYDAMALCTEQGKRLCWESEWIAACEGPNKLPFPYGYARDPKKCNIDNRYIKPSLEKFYSTDERISGPELTRLDQGVPSGGKPECKSGFGVHDQTGNVDEWVMLETKRGKGGWAGLKGGAWGHVRNACRPVTTSHVAEFTYYNISFRCCADAKPDPAGGAPPWTPPPLPKNEKPKGKLFRGWTPN